MKSDAIIPASQAYTLFMLFDDVQVIVGYTRILLRPRQAIEINKKKYRVCWSDWQTNMILVEEIPHA